MIKKSKNKILNNIYRYSIFIISMFILSATYNMFLLPKHLVTGGVGGIAVMLQETINPSVLIFIINILLIIASYIILGRKATTPAIVGAISYPIFISLTSNINNYITLNTNDLILDTLFAAVLIGGSIGFIIKNGFSTGGTDIAASIVSKLFKISMGNSFLIIDGIIILIGTFFFGIVNTMYAIIFIYIYSIVIDKIILGISDNKAFYIVTNKDKEIRNYIINELQQGVTLLSARGGYKGSKQNVLFCVVSVKNYFKLREGINEIDENAFFMVTDAYEVKGGA